MGMRLVGVLQLAEVCTLRVAAAHARLGHPQVEIGAVAGFGYTTRLPRSFIGKGRATELLLTGKLITAAEALTRRQRKQGCGPWGICFLRQKALSTIFCHNHRLP